MSDAPTSPPAGSTSWLALVLGTLVALTIIGSSAVAVALPQLAAELGLDVAGKAWVLAAFGLTFAIATAFFGRLADQVGLRRPLLIGVGLLTVGSVAASTAPTFAWLIAGRLVQGAGSGAVPVLVTGVISARFDGRARARMLGAIGSIVSLVSGSGPLIGGALAQAVSWRLVLALPVLAVVLVRPVARLAPEVPEDRSGRLDTPGALLVGLTVAGFMLLLQAPGGGLPTPLTAAVAVTTVAGAAATAWWARRRPHGFLPREVTSNRRMLRTAAAGFGVLAAWLAALLAVPSLLAAQQAWPPLVIGLAMLPGAATGAVAARVVSTIGAGWDRGRTAATLLLVAAGGLVLIATSPQDPVRLGLGFALIATGFAAGQVALIDAVPRLVPARVQGVALGVFNLAFFSGGAVGSAAAGGLEGLLGLPGAVGVVAAIPAGGAAFAVGITRRLAAPADADAGRCGA